MKNKRVVMVILLLVLTTLILGCGPEYDGRYRMLTFNRSCQEKGLDYYQEGAFVPNNLYKCTNKENEVFEYYFDFNN